MSFDSITAVVPLVAGLVLASNKPKQRSRSRLIAKGCLRWLALQERGPWQATLRALCAIEAVIEGGSSASCGEVAVHFQVDGCASVC